MKWSGILIFLLGFSLQGQISTEFKKYKEEHPNSHSVRLIQESIINIEVDKEGAIQITQENLEEDLYLDESATYNSKQSLNFSSFYEMEEIAASSYILKDGEYEEIEVTDFKEKDELEDSFYDDTKSVNFIYPNLNASAKTSLRYRQKINNPRFLNAFYLGNFYPIIKNKLSIIADKNIDLDFREMNTDTIQIKFTKTESKKKIHYTWEVENINEYEYEDNAPTYKRTLPHIIPIIRSYEVEGEEKKVLGGVSDLYNWYYSLIQNINEDEVDKELAKLVNNITADKSNDFEKVRAIYYWTQENIKYIAFEYALGGFVPRAANEVFRKKYGDCKDNSSILLRMLEIAGIEGSITWIGTRSIPYKYEEVPTPIVDNHMILAYQDQGTTYFLDATGRYATMELPTSFIQGKEALIALGDNEYKIEKVPVISATKNALRDKSVINLEGDLISGSSKTEISGYKKIDFYYALEDKNTESKIKEFYNSNFLKGNNSFLLESLSEKNKYSYDKDLAVDYKFKLANYAKRIGDEIYINLNLNKELLSFRTEEDRKSALEYDYKTSYDYETTFNVPEDYTVTYLPSDFSFSNEYITTDIKYSLKDNQLIYKHSISLNFLELDLNAQKEVNELIKKIAKEYKQVIVLNKQ